MLPVRLPDSIMFTFTASMVLGTVDGNVAAQAALSG